MKPMKYHSFYKLFLASLFPFWTVAADSLTIEGDLAVEAAGSSDGDLSADDELTVNLDDSVVSPAVKASFKVESNGVIWAGYGDKFSSEGMHPEGNGSRLMWLPEKSAFRAGSADAFYGGTDMEEIGQFSVAFGDGSQSRGYGSAAFGVGTTANTAFSSAFGAFNISLPIVPGSEPLFEVGNGIDPWGKSNALTILRDGRIALGHHLSYPSELDETVQINGALLVGDYDNFQTATPSPGAIRFDSSATDFEGYDGTEWKSLTQGDGGTAIAASELVVPGTSDVKLSVNASGAVLLSEAQGDIPMFGQ
ncbi:hypothetical protein [Puniceicoccus vermicola]|uniref:Transferrin-binding protein-like solute binding protein n=1 Tax=Puniceicoccus vermicola TaxID=388746 RepID=A0A7X1B1J3_9BACT|nr:hypothetical protein [Puniceicoccus vermicola]MBC2603914.1 hypothetical protein [Puniceicoccus vermicola]